MIKLVNNLFAYRELLLTLAWKEIVVRYKQAYLGLAWSVLKPVMLTVIFIVIRSFVGIENGNIPYPILTFAALMPWVFFQEATSQGIESVVNNAALVKKIYFPREVFPVTAVLTKVVELSINFILLACLMIYYQMPPTVHILWVPTIIFYTFVVSLTLSLIGSAMNVYYRDVQQLLPVAISLMMYISPIIYPLSLVRKTLIEKQAAGSLSDLCYFLYTLNPLAGIIDSFQRVLLQGVEPDYSVLWPGVVLTFILLPISYKVFKKAEYWFADVI